MLLATWVRKIKNLIPITIINIHTQLTIILSFIRKCVFFINCKRKTII